MNPAYPWLDVPILVGITLVLFLPFLFLVRNYLGGGLLARLLTFFYPLLVFVALCGYFYCYVGGTPQLGYIAIIVGLGVAALALTLYLVYRQLTQPLKQMTGLLTRVAVGDLSQTSDFHSRDELGQLADAFRQMVEYQRGMSETTRNIAAGNLNITATPLSAQDELGVASQTMVGALNNMLRQTSTVVAQVDQGIDQVRQVSQSLAAGAGEQSTAAEEVSANLEETGAQITGNAENAGLANQLAGETAALAQAGQAQMQNMTAAMTAIAGSSRAIGKIIKVIDEIAFQTNLLALNAAVEAARAGQQGRGFAVVAQEVRNLAVRSAKAAKETAELIESAGARVEEGVTISAATAAALTEIVQKVLKVRDLVAEIAVASDEQAKGIKQVNQAMGQVSQGAQSTSAQSEELASTAEELANLANTLRQAVSHFKLRAGAAEVPAEPRRLGTQPAAGQHGADKPGSLDRDERGYGNF